MEGFNELKKEDLKVIPNEENKIRPITFNDYVGQEEIKSQLSVFIKAAKIKNMPLSHILFYGPPGLGKTTLATIIANEMGSKIHYTSAPAIEKPADLATLLLNLQDGDILFIDEIHRLKIQTEEMLYPAMEDRVLDIAIQGSRENKLVRLPLKNFTLIGATTKPGKLSNPFRDRFKIQQQLKFYELDELKQIVKRSAKICNLVIEDSAAEEIAQRSRGTARISNNLLIITGDYAIVENNYHVTLEVAKKAMNMMKIDEFGLDSLDRKVIYSLYVLNKNKPTGIRNLASSVQEELETIENVVEPYLIQKNLIMRTERGRVLTDIGINYAEKMVAEGFAID